MVKPPRSGGFLFAWPSCPEAGPPACPPLSEGLCFSRPQVAPRPGLLVQEDISHTVTGGIHMITPNLPNPFRGEHKGDVSISGESFELRGMIVGNVTISNEGNFFCKGTVTRNVYVDDSSTAIIHGTINGNVSGAGNIQVFGVVHNRL